MQQHRKYPGSKGCGGVAPCPKKMRKLRNNGSRGRSRRIKVGNEKAGIHIKVHQYQGKEVGVL